jgi:sarcosine oxidase delta subunit
MSVRRRYLNIATSLIQIIVERSDVFAMQQANTWNDFQFLRENARRAMRKMQQNKQIMRLDKFSFLRRRFHSS